MVADKQSILKDQSRLQLKEFRRFPHIVQEDTEKCCYRSLQTNTLLQQNSVNLVFDHEDFCVSHPYLYIVANIHTMDQWSQMAEQWGSRASYQLVSS